MPGFLTTFTLLLIPVKLSLQCKSSPPPVTDTRTIQAERRIQLERLEDVRLNPEMEEQTNSLEDSTRSSQPSFLEERERAAETLTLEERARNLGLELEEIEEVRREREGKQSRVLPYLGQEEVKACYSMARKDWKLYDSVVREKVNRFNIESCAGECKTKVYCRSFAFSESEFLSENCYLSELSWEGDVSDEKVETDGERHDMWALYTVAETCDDLTAEPSDELPDSKIFTSSNKGCECNGFIDSEGQGECRTRDGMGRYWCYADTGSCQDGVQDPFLPFLIRTTAPCSLGPCECNSYNFTQSSSHSVCMGDVFDSSTYCYVSLDSRCSDKQPSKFFPSFQWSMSACSPSTPFDPDEVEAIYGSRVVETEGRWNFTSSYLECMDYCSMNERCKSMYTHYDADIHTCYLSTRPMFITVTTYTHHHGEDIPLHSHITQTEDAERLF